jgi:hypothetical protein
MNAKRWLTGVVLPAAITASIIGVSRLQGRSRLKADWPFEDPTKLAVITTRRIVQGERSILLVVHDVDGDWQFLDGEAADTSSAMVVGLGNIVKRDESLRILADLPCGWRAWRANANISWQRSEIVE